jgi:archaemetzincin
MSSGSARVIHVLPLGPVAHQDLMVVAAAARQLLDCSCVVLPAVPLPPRAFRPARAQYDADALLDFLFDRLGIEVLRVVGVTDLDLFAEGRNFVFGYAHMRDRVAVFSTLRLKEVYWGRPDDPGRYRTRLAKALTHELGHTFHVPHCEAPRCVMHQVELLWQLDELDLHYCPACDEAVAQVAFRRVDDPASLFELGGSHMRRRRYARAAAAYAAACRREPDNAHYHNDHGVALLALGERAAAARAFQQAVRLRPTMPHAYYNLGIVARERGDVGTADYFFGEALKRDGDRVAAHRYLGILHQDYFHDSGRAREHLERCRMLGGTDPDVTRRLAALTGRVLSTLAVESGPR